MDYKKLSIIFVIILLPISIVLSEYIQNQIDTLALQTEYKTMLISSTYDAVTAYQINTQSASIATGEDNKRYVLASVNTFFNSLATNMGVSGTSKIDLQSYVPAILFTSYDGYYIYSPTKMPEVATDENGLGLIDGDGDIRYLKENQDTTVVDEGEINEKTTKDVETALENNPVYEYMVKPYIYYSASYSGTDYNVVINYSLDNYITVYGQINGKSFTKSGYLIDYKSVKVNGNLYMKTYGYEGSTQTISDNNLVDYVDSIDGMENYINDYDETFDNGSNANFYKSGSLKDQRFQTGDEIIKYSLDKNGDIKVSYKDNSVEDVEAKEYYIKAYYFSKWIDENLGNIVKVREIKSKIDDNSGFSEQIKIHFDEDDETKFLNIYDGENLINNPEAEDSVFNQHKRLVIQNSILYSLNSAISTYDGTLASSTTSYELPVLTDDDWDKILSNISMTVFLQGVPCGTKYYNDYTTITSTNNNQYIDKNNLYFTEKLDNRDDYHKIDCPDLGTDGITSYEADISAEFKYDAKEVKIVSNEIMTWYDTDGENASTNQSQEKKTREQFFKDNKDNIRFYDSSTNTYYTYNNNTWEKDNSDSSSYKDEVTVHSTGEVMTAYIYDHKNTGCYNCIVSNNYIPVVEFNEDGEMELSSQVLDSSGNLTTYGSSKFANAEVAKNELKKRKEAWYTYIAKYRNNIYKTNAYINR